MKFTLSWLKEHLKTNYSIDQIIDALNKIGLEVNNINSFKSDVVKLQVAEITKIFKHPNADKLKVCLIKTNDGEKQVVCGAPNVSVNKKYVFAPVGTYISGISEVLKKIVIRNVESNGMLCSERELEISENHDGIIELPNDLELDANVSSFLGIDDPIIEIEITPNRGDCLGVRGIARDLAAYGVGNLLPLKFHDDAPEFTSFINWKIELPLEKEDLCPKILGRSFKNVKNIKSPQWMINRLKAIGLRPISSLVDITNYIMIDIGRPLHAYDVDKINGKFLTVRQANDNEEFQALNGKTYNLKSDMLVICDEKGPDDLAGIMGGTRTGIDNDTTKVFLESAIFSPSSVAKTGRSLNIQSDARYRFERGLDFESPEIGIKYASHLIRDICGGSISNIVNISKTCPKKEIVFDPKIVKKIIGIDIDILKIQNILKKLGFDFSENKKIFKVSIPTWRNDIERKEDLVEEIIRIHGYDKIPTNVLPSNNYITKPSLTDKLRQILYSRKCMASRGFNEVITFSFLDQSNAKIFGGGLNDLKLVNPISSELSDLRPSIIPNLLNVSYQNLNRGIARFSLFEVGPVFRGDKYEDQLNVNTGLRFGNKFDKNWKHGEVKYDFYDIKADILSVLSILEFPVERLKISDEAPEYFHTGRSAVFKLGPKIISFFGQISPKVVNPKFQNIEFYAFEIFLDNIPIPNKKNAAKPLLKINTLQSLHRDFSFLIDQSLNVKEVIDTIKDINIKLIKNVTVFDIYKGKNIPTNKKSVALSVEIQPLEKSLTDKDLDDLSSDIIKSLYKKLDAEIRLN